DLLHNRPVRGRRCRHRELVAAFRASARPRRGVAHRLACVAVFALLQQALDEGVLFGGQDFAGGIGSVSWISTTMGGWQRLPTERAGLLSAETRSGKLFYSRS